MLGLRAMDTDLQDLRRALATRRRGRLPSTLQKRALAYARRRHRAGVDHRDIATTLGLSHETIRRWVGGRAVDVVKPLPIAIVESDKAPVARAVSVISPAGFRVDGLSLDEAATLLRALR